MNIFNDLRQLYTRGQLPIKFIFINVALFLAVRLIEVICTLLGNPFTPTPYLALSSNLTVLSYHPYTVITYMFYQHDVWHLLFNMLWLYWFGRLFLLSFNAKQFVGVYVWGGLCGAILYLLSYNLFPYFTTHEGILLGSSAAVLAVVFAVSTYMPDYKIRLFLIGNISLKYIALATVVLDLLSITSQNAGGHIAHIGGALLGIFFTLRYKKGRDITRGFNRMIDALASLFSSHPEGRSKVKWNSGRTSPSGKRDEDFLRHRQENAAEIDRILDKIKQSGYNALTKEEKKRLFEAGKK
ncbi:MAG: rhomboid family intramembrane serine protease [Porphyromonadaceae bacterium]|nr:rhomboid family intramembrane serine protease [Porphyromonadaceae bacterium]